MARIVRTVPERALSDEYQLDNWLHGSETRRQTYFAFADHTREELTALLGTAPPDESLVLILIAAVSEDETFVSHLVVHGGGSALADPESWKRFTRAGAATILESYHDAVESGSWP